MDSNISTITVKGVTKEFLRPDGTLTRVIDNVSFDLRSSKFSALIGPNGGGKSTLLNMIAKLLQPDAGEIQAEGFRSSPPKVGYVWQSYKDSLLPWFNVEDNIAFSLRAEGKSWADGRIAARQLLESFLPDVDPLAKTYQLSGGQQQMISLLRAVVSEPDVLLLDEPFSSLDQHRSWNMALYVEKIWRERPIPVLFISHDVDEAVLLADDIWLLSQHGRLVGHVSNPLPRPRIIDMLTNPQHVECRNKIITFLRSENGATVTSNELSVA